MEIFSLQHSTGLQQPVDERELAEHDGKQKRPNESFAQPQPALAGGRKPELKFDRAKRNNVAVVEQRGFNRFAIDHDQGVLRRHESEAFPTTEFKCQVLIPGAIVCQLQVISVGAADAERKTADNRLAARLFSRENVKLNHQKIRRGTII
jgi:hypothetical protein